MPRQVSTSRRAQLSRPSVRMYLLSAAENGSNLQHGGASRRSGQHAGAMLPSSGIACHADACRER
jgi:hypothetical protein